MTNSVKFINCRPVEQKFVAEVFNILLTDIRPLGWVGGALAFLALCKVGFVSGFCVLLQCAKNSVVQRRQSHANLNVSRMLVRVTYNVKVLEMARNSMICHLDSH